MESYIDLFEGLEEIDWENTQITEPLNFEPISDDEFLAASPKEDDGSSEDEVTSSKDPLTVEPTRPAVLPKEDDEYSEDDVVSSKDSPPTSPADLPVVLPASTRRKLKRKISPIRAPSPKKTCNFERRSVPRLPSNTDSRPTDPRLPSNTDSRPTDPRLSSETDSKLPFELPPPPFSTTPSWKADSSFNPKELCQFHHHSVNCVLAVREKEYCFSDGYTSIYKAIFKDLPRRLDTDLQRTLVRRCVRSLFGVDPETHDWLEKWKKVWRRDHPVYGKPVNVWKNEGSTPPCSYCMRTNCVRFMTIRTGHAATLRL